MKLIEKQKIGTKARKKYDTPVTRCDRLPSCAKVSEETKVKLRTTRSGLDPMDLAADIEEERQEEMNRAGEKRMIVVVSTLLDPVAYPAENILMLSVKRWDIERRFRDIKITIGMHIFHVKITEMEHKNLRMRAIADRSHAHYLGLKLVFKTFKIFYRLPSLVVSFKEDL